MSRLTAENVLAGLLFLAVGLAGLWLGRTLNVGTLEEMGEGFFPLAMCWLLVVLGALIAGVGLFKPGEQAERVTWHAPFWITAAVLAFAATLESLGVIVATFVSVVIATFAGSQARARSTIMLAAVLTLAVLAIFVWGLGLPLRALPRALL
jgi:hypothetical protein